MKSTAMLLAGALISAPAGAMASGQSVGAHSTDVPVHRAPARSAAAAPIARSESGRAPGAPRHSTTQNKRLSAVRGLGAANAVLRATLDNGLRVVIVRNRLAPVVTTEMNYLVGSDQAPADFPGMAHAQEHMMFRGSPGLSAEQLSAITAGMGGDFNADTQSTVTQYAFTVPAADLGVALHVEAARMRGVLDREEDWKRERPALEQEVAQDLSDPQYLLYTDLLARFFKGTPAARDALGTRASFDQTTGAMLRGFYETWYAPNNAILVVAGNVDPEATLAQVQELFGAIPAKVIPARAPVHLEPVTAQTLRRKTDLPYGLAVVAFRMPGYRSPDFAAADVLADTLDSPRGPLYDLVVDGEALSVEFSMTTLPEASIGYATAAFPRRADGEKLLTDIQTIIDRVAHRGVSPDLVVAAKLGERTQSEAAGNSIPGLANVWSQALAVEGRNSPDEDLRAVQRVRPAGVDRVARDYLASDRSVTAVLTPRSSDGAVASKRFSGKESFAPAHVGEVVLPAWAQSAIERLSVPPQDLHPDSMVLPNGLRLIVQPAAVGDVVAVYGHVRTGPSLQVASGKEGVDEVLSQLFSYGTTELDRVRFQKALDDIGAMEVAGADFSLQVLTEHLDRGLELLAQNELTPALPERAFLTVRAQAAAAVEGELQSPGYLTTRALKKSLLPPGDPELRHATPDSVRRLELRDVREYYRRVFRPDLTTIVVIGDITPQQATALIERYFGAWRAQGPKPQIELPAIPENQPATLHVADDSRIQDEVTLAETLPINRHDLDYYALRLGNRVLSGGFYATRLYRQLREENGLVYYVDSDLDVGKTRGFYTVSYGCDPPNVSRVRDLVAGDLREMQTTPVGPSELQRAKALLLKEVSLSQDSVEAIADGLLRRTAEGLPLDEPWRAAQQYIALNAEQVQSAFRRCLHVDDLVQVTEGPTPQ